MDKSIIFNFWGQTKDYFSPLILRFYFFVMSQTKLSIQKYEITKSSWPKITWYWIMGWEDSYSLIQGHKNFFGCGNQATNMPKTWLHLPWDIAWKSNCFLFLISLALALSPFLLQSRLDSTRMLSCYCKDRENEKKASRKRENP